MELDSKITFIVGENGSGKSTLLEAIADKCGFNLEGGSRDHSYGTSGKASRTDLADALRLSWMPKVTSGFFLRAESFFNFATYIDELDEGGYAAYGGSSLHRQSHGESFLALFINRFKKGLFILDEPEAALSPQRQLAFLAILSELEKAGTSQFIIASHSPMLIAYPGATVFSLDSGSFQKVDYRQTEQFRLMKHFLDSPERYFHQLFGSP
jgi:predicted ATPase